jgi:hypothetical protein
MLPMLQNRWIWWRMSQKKNQHKQMQQCVLCVFVCVCVCVYIYIELEEERLLPQNACLMTEKGASMAASSIKMSSNEWALRLLCRIGISCVRMVLQHSEVVCIGFYFFNAVASLSYMHWFFVF